MSHNKLSMTCKQKRKKKLLEKKPTKLKKTFEVSNSKSGSISINTHIHYCILLQEGNVWAIYSIRI